MKQSIYISFLLLFGISSYSQVLKEEIEKYSLTVAYIYSENIETVNQNGAEIELWFKDPSTGKLKPKLITNTGTGFFIYKKDRYSTYLVTAAHVAKNTNLETKVVVAGVAGKPIIKNLKDIILNPSELEWNYSNNSDVANILLNMEFMDEKNNNIRTLSIDFLDDKYTPDRSRDLTCVGFPLNLGFENYFSPITKTSKPASGFIELKNPETARLEKVFLLDDSTTPGFSGSPVFEFPNQILDKRGIMITMDTKVVGLVQGYISNRGQINSGGFAAIVPASIIKEEIESSKSFTGIIEYEYQNGNPWSKVEVKNGIPIKVYYNYNNDGLEQDKGSLINGNGTLNIYDEEGNLIEIRTYQNNKLIKTDKNDVR